MAITQHGLDEVKEAYENAVKNLDKITLDHINATTRVVKLEVAMTCDHDKLKDLGGFMYSTTRCEQCGYEWSDY